MYSSLGTCIKQGLISRIPQAPTPYAPNPVDITKLFSFPSNPLQKKQQPQRSSIPSLPTSSVHPLQDFVIPLLPGLGNQGSPLLPAARKGLLVRDFATKRRALVLFPADAVLEAELLTRGAAGLDAKDAGQDVVALLLVGVWVGIGGGTGDVCDGLENSGTPSVTGDVGGVVVSLALFGACKFSEEIVLAVFSEVLKSRAEIYGICESEDPRKPFLRSKYSHPSPPQITPSHRQRYDHLGCPKK